MSAIAIPGLGSVDIRPIDEDYPRPKSHSIYDDWGDFAPEARTMSFSRWLIEFTTVDGEVDAVGDMSSHAIWYGPTPGSRAMNIGISLIESHRGMGIGSAAQSLLAAELHRQGIVRVEAGTDVANIAEQRSLQKAGFRYEGTARSAQSRADGLHDLQIWSHVEDS
ncbi:acetyltransferase (GNAT) family protein [mine drainage metagenome]|uniref:Acetyltransferase (GNAT) family protein n=1 Tax=mine drainage metagenome TaxID=410659 RepID=A0A1J5QU97_9ZZZZ